MEKQAILQSLAEVTNAIAKVAEAIANSNPSNKLNEETLMAAFKAGYGAACDKFDNLCSDSEFQYFSANGELGGDSFDVEINIEDHLDNMMRCLTNGSHNLNDHFYEWKIDNARDNGEQA